MLFFHYITRAQKIQVFYGNSTKFRLYRRLLIAFMAKKLYNKVNKSMEQ